VTHLRAKLIFVLALSVVTVLALQGLFRIPGLSWWDGH
jgi:hypothetical protein